MRNIDITSDYTIEPIYQTKNLGQDWEVMDNGELLCTWQKLKITQLLKKTNALKCYEALNLSHESSYN